MSQSNATEVKLLGETNFPSDDDQYDSFDRYSNHNTGTKSLISINDIENVIKRNQSSILHVSCEVIVLLSVFLAALYTYKETETITLIPSTQCHSCNGECIPLRSLNQQADYSYLRMNFQSRYLDSNGVYQTNYTVIDFESTWSSCQVDSPATFTHNAGLNMSSFVLPSINNHTDYMPYMDDASIVKMTITPDFSYDGLEQYPPIDCFTLTCNMRSVPGWDQYNVDIKDVATLNNADETPVIVAQLYGQILVKEPGSVSANCYASISGTLIPISSASNTVTQSSVYQCTSHPNTISAVAIALSYTLTLASLIHLAVYFWNVFHSKPQSTGSKR